MGVCVCVDGCVCVGGGGVASTIQSGAQRGKRQMWASARLIAKAPAPLRLQEREPLHLHIAYA